MVKMFALVSPHGVILPESVSSTKSQSAQKANRVANGKLYTVEEVEVRLCGDEPIVPNTEETQTEPVSVKKGGFWSKF